MFSVVSFLKILEILHDIFRVSEVDIFMVWLVFTYYVNAGSNSPSC